MSTSTQSASPLSKFTMFPNLPFELRLLIWQKTLEPRVVEVTCDEDSGFTTYSRLPMALQICRESRDTVEPLYPCCFGSIFHPSRIRFNFSLDTLYIDSMVEGDLPHLFATFGELEINGIQSLAMDEEIYALPGDLDDEYDITRGLRRAVESLKVLKELLFVYDIETMASSANIGCGQQHDIDLFIEIPAELHDVPIAPLISSEDFAKEISHHWKVPICRPIYGWRRCPSMGTRGMDWGRGGARGLGIDSDDDELNLGLSSFLLANMRIFDGDEGLYPGIFDDDDDDEDDEDTEDEDEERSIEDASENSWVDEEESDKESLD